MGIEWGWESFRVARLVSLRSFVCFVEPCNPLIFYEVHKKSINWIPYDRATGTVGLYKATRTFFEIPWRNEQKTGSLVFIDWWPCMHVWAISDSNVHRHSSVCRFFLLHSTEVDLSETPRGAGGGRKSPSSPFFFKNSYSHIVVSSVFRYISGWMRSMMCT